jgi:hypothetical protein
MIIFREDCRQSVEEFRSDALKNIGETHGQHESTDADWMQQD